MDVLVATEQHLHRPEVLRISYQYHPAREQTGVHKELHGDTAGTAGRGDVPHHRASGTTTNHGEAGQGSERPVACQVKPQQSVLNKRKTIITRYFKYLKLLEKSASNAEATGGS